MKESKVWRMVAEKLDDGQDFRGICYAKTFVLDNLFVSGMLSHRTYNLMYDAMNNHIGQHVADHTKYAYAYPPGTEREARILAALWLALEAEEEA